MKITGVMLAALLFGTCSAAATDEYDHVIHPGAADGSGFWNKNAKWFMYAPAFAFNPVAGATAYRFTVVDDLHEKRTFTTCAQTDSLAPVWGKLPTGFVTVTCEGIGADGRVVGLAGERTFWKAAGFREGAYPKAAKPYCEAAIGVYDYVFNMKETRYLLQTGKPDPSYDLNSYVSKMMAALVKGMVRYGDLAPERRATAFAVARAAADHLIAKSEPADAPLAFFPPTYDGRGEKGNNAGERYRGQVMLIYPATVARAFLDLAKATGETRYREAAERIAATYLKLQGEDGTWFLKMTAADGKGVGANRLVPIQCVTPMFERLFAETGKPEYRKAADRSFASVEGRLSDWNWEGQFEDVPPTARYENLTKHDACSTAIYLAGRCPDDPTRRNQVRKLLRFAEDQFVCWEPPFRNGRLPSAVRGKLWSGNYDVWVTPCALEQYNCHWPIDASAAKLIRTYLAVYRLEGRREDLAKARALGDTATRMQCADGRIPTWWWPARAKVVSADWINCMLAMADALMELDEFKETP